MQRPYWFKAVRLVSATALVLALARTSGLAQSVPDLPQPSPHARVEQRVGLTDISVDYSSPGVKGRKIWGELLPYDTLWRSGANAATKLTSSRDFTFGGKPVPAGTYAVFSIPGKSSWTVILNTVLTGSSTIGYDESKDVARVTVKPESIPLRERLAFLFSNTTEDSTRLDLEWEKLRLSVPIEVATRTQVLGNIDKALDDAWRPHFNSARWLLDNGGDLTQALAYIDTSIAIKPTWWNNWVRAQILAKQGQTAGAIEAAEKAQDVGKGDQVYEGFFSKDIAKAIAGWKK